MILLTLDPGLSTGYSFWNFSEDKPLEFDFSGVIDGGCEGFMDWYDDNVDADFASVIVCERFVIDGTHTGVWSAQIEGALIALTSSSIVSDFGRYMMGKPVWQLRSDKATLFNQEFEGKAGQTERFNWLRERGFEGEGHELDAITHALVWAKRMGHIPTLRKYWGDE